jgi:hypothetical protein
MMKEYMLDWVQSIKKTEIDPSTHRIRAFVKAESISDGYHTMAELYDHRCALFAAFAKTCGLSTYKTPVDEGWFVAGVILPSGQCGYHLPESMHSAFVATVEAPEWDGHTSSDALSRIMAFVGV